MVTAPLKVTNVFEEDIYPQKTYDSRSMPGEGKNMYSSYKGPWLKQSCNAASRYNRPHNASPYFFSQRYMIPMTKTSLFSLIFGLMLLGTLFFSAGFLVALSIFEPHRPAPPPPPADVWSETNRPRPSQPQSVAGGLIRRQLATSAGQLMQKVPGSHTIIGTGIASNIRSSITNPAATPVPGAAPAAPPPAAQTPPPPVAQAAAPPGAAPAAGQAPPPASGKPPAPK